MRVDPGENDARPHDFASIAHAVAIINPISGSGLDAGRAASRVQLVETTLRRHVGDVRVQLTEGAGHASALAREAVAEGADLVIAWGGDGTVNEVASALVHADTTFGLVPAGSGNGLAASLGTPRDPAAALARILSAPPRRIDVGTIGRRHFFNIAGIGFDAHIAGLFNSRGGGRRGGWPYVVLGVREGCLYRSLDYEVDLEGEVRQVRALLIAFANGREYGMGMRLSPGARLDDGRLESTIVEDRAVPARFWDTRFLAYGRVPDAPGVAVRAVTRATISANGTMQFHADGEAGTAESRIEIGLLPGALQVRG
jgi:YegS/Rv2252/BmrU family lipid kinase